MWYLVMRVRKWEDLELEANLPLPSAHIKPDKGDVGFCPVFSDWATALEYAGDDVSLILPVQTKDKTA